MIFKIKIQRKSIKIFYRFYCTKPGLDGFFTEFIKKYEITQNI